jgi:15,16-dihydrobiliverdin:ferredoxin oxidoreductase
MPTVRQVVALSLVAQSLLVLSANAWLSWSRIQEFTNPRQNSRGLPKFINNYKAALLEPIPRTPPSDERKSDRTNDLSKTSTLTGGAATVQEAEHSYGMPWQSSIDPAYDHDQLFYMPFWEFQLDFMKKNLKNLSVIPTIDRTQQRNDLTYVQNVKKKKRMITLCFESDEYRLIRLTYLDAGATTQVFTSLWYPRANLPVLGIDFLQFNNQTRHLTVVDMQPIHTSEEEHDVKYSHLLEPIRDSYPSLQNRMSTRFYDENQFFSSQMLLGRGDNGPDYVWEELLPAYKEYVNIHLQIVHKARNIPQGMDYTEVLRRHKAYDDYSSVRDPAHGLLKAIFGSEYADAFVHDVLFPLSEGVKKK